MEILAQEEANKTKLAILKERNTYNERTDGALCCIFTRYVSYLICLLIYCQHRSSYVLILETIYLKGKFLRGACARP